MGEIASRLPIGYTEVEYIQNIATSYIDLGIDIFANAASESANIPPKVEVYVDVVQQGSVWQAVFGVRYQINDVDSGLISTSNTNRWFSRINNGNYYLDKPITGKHLCVLENWRTYLDGTVFTNSNSSPRYSATTMAILAVHNARDNNYSDLGLKCKIYYVKVWRRNILAVNAIPCVNRNGIAGLYDVVRNRFFSSLTSTEFVAGRVII